MTTTLPAAKAKTPKGIDRPDDLLYVTFKKGSEPMELVAGLVLLGTMVGGLFAIIISQLAGVAAEQFLPIIGAGILAANLIGTPIVVRKVSNFEKTHDARLTSFLDAVVDFAKTRYGIDITFLEAAGLVGSKDAIDVTTEDGERIAVRFSTNSDGNDGRLVQMTNARELPLI